MSIIFFLKFVIYLVGNFWSETPLAYSRKNPKMVGGEVEDMEFPGISRK